MTTFVPEVPLADIEALCTRFGFERIIVAHEGVKEVVFERTSHQCKHVKMRVYTSVRDGEAVARDCGEDSIKVSAIWQWGDNRRGVYKGKRIHRTGSVEKILARIEERVRDGYTVMNEFIKSRDLCMHADCVLMRKKHAFEKSKRLSSQPAAVSASESKS